MPTTYAHYRLGEEVRKKVSSSVQEIINNNLQLFHFGVHGPDHLFYYNPLRGTWVGRIGSKTHEEPAKKFFTRAARVIYKSDNRNAHSAYVYGYLCHFAMDYVCHGYIGEQMEEKGFLTRNPHTTYMEHYIGQVLNYGLRYESLVSIDRECEGNH